MRVFIIAAITADGFIGRHSLHGSDWTSPEDKKIFVKLTKEAGVMVMGSRTFATIKRALPGRRNIVLTTHPDAIRVEGVEATDDTPEELITRLKKEGETGLAVCGGATVYEQFMRVGAVTELYLTVEPLLFGKGVPLFSDELDVELELLDTEQINKNAILLHYKVLRP
jgi:dihydrofolate reductase